MLKKHKLLLIFSSILLTFVLYGSFLVNKTSAVTTPGCCTGLPDNRTCVAAATCASGQRPCIVENDTQADLNKDGQITADEKYNPECFIPVIAPDAVKITDFGKLFSGAVGLLLLIAFIMSFLYLVLGGISWVTSGGDKAAVEAARNKILAALIGLIIVAATWALFQLIGGAIGFNILRGFDIPRLF